MGDKTAFAVVFTILVVGGLLVFAWIEERQRFEEYQDELRLLAYVDELVSNQESVTVFKSVNASEAFQWALDNHGGSLGIIYRKDGFVYVNFTIVDEPPLPEYPVFFSETFANEHFYGITAYNSKFTNCTIDMSALYHCHFVDSNVTSGFVYAGLFESKYGARYVDCSDGRMSFNVTSWWDDP